MILINTAFLSLQSVNVIVPGSKVLSTAISLAEQITANSPDAVQSSKVALLLSQKHNFQETFTTHNLSPENRRVYRGANIKVGWFLIYVNAVNDDLHVVIVEFQEGLKAFTEVSCLFNEKGLSLSFSFCFLILFPC